MKKQSGISTSELEKIIKDCEKIDQKSFTLELKQIERASGGKYCCLNIKQSQHVFDESLKIFDNNDDSTIKYNALRLAKYGVDINEALKHDYKKPWSLYLKTIFYADGRIRTAGINLLDRYYFGLSQSSKNEEVDRLLIDMFLYLQNLEDEYIQKHEDKLGENDLPDFAGRIPWSSDTKDKFLKTIRRGIEILTRGPMDELMETYGYQQRTSDEFSELDIFQRYEKVHDHKTVTNSKNMQTYIIRAKLQHDKRVYRDIEIPERMTLYHVARAILDSFDFNFDHLFGFGNKPGFYHSEIQYELKNESDPVPEMFKNNNRGDVEKAKVQDVPFFQKQKDKIYFLFDFGDDWAFEIELKDFGKYINDKKYPIVLKKNGDAPAQYPEWD